MSNLHRIEARQRALKMIAKVTTAAAITLAVAGMTEARAAESGAVTRSDTEPLPFEGQMRVRGGDCGCAPCWGPPVPPRRGASVA